MSHLQSTTDRSPQLLQYNQVLGLMEEPGRWVAKCLIMFLGWSIVFVYFNFFTKDKVDDGFSYAVSVFLFVLGTSAIVSAIIYFYVWIHLYSDPPREWEQRGDQQSQDLPRFGEPRNQQRHGQRLVPREWEQRGDQQSQDLPSFGEPRNQPRHGQRRVYATGESPPLRSPYHHDFHYHDHGGYFHPFRCRFGEPRNQQRYGQRLVPREWEQRGDQQSQDLQRFGEARNQQQRHGPIRVVDATGELQPLLAEERRKLVKSRLLSRRLVEHAEMVSNPSEMLVETPNTTEKEGNGGDVIAQTWWFHRDCCSWSQWWTTRRRTRLSRPVLQSVETSVQNLTCAICLHDFQTGETVCWAKVRECNHIFHEDCIVRWLECREDCPLCRQNLLADEPNVC